MGTRGASRWLVVAALVAGVGCSSATLSSPSNSSGVPTTARPSPSESSIGTELPTNNDAPTPTGFTAESTTIDPTDELTTTSQSTASPSTTSQSPGVVGPSAPTAACEMTAPAAYGEITWLADGQLLSTGDGVTSACLATGVDSNVPTQWSPTGGSALLDAATIVGPSTTRPSGYGVDDGSVSWSQPTGKALIDVDPASHRLIWHSATSSEVADISFLEQTDLAVYHPSGKAIAAVGVDEHGQYGLWLASNRGENRKLITSIDDPSTPATELAFSSDGSSLYFIHGFLHQLNMFELSLDEFGQADRSEANLTSSTVEPYVAITTGGCDVGGTILAYGWSGELDLRSAADSPFHDGQTIQPVGWLAGGRLVIAARSQGCSGPADIWTWTNTTGAFRRIGAGWDAVSVRIQRGTFVELPDEIEQAAPG